MMQEEAARQAVAAPGVVLAQAAVAQAPVGALQEAGVLALVAGGRVWEGAARVAALVLARVVVLGWARVEEQVAVDSSSSSSSKDSKCTQ
jgi:hypothetical protein